MRVVSTPSAPVPRITGPGAYRLFAHTPWASSRLTRPAGDVRPGIFDPTLRTTRSRESLRTRFTRYPSSRRARTPASPSSRTRPPARSRWARCRGSGCSGGRLAWASLCWCLRRLSCARARAPALPARDGPAPAQSRICGRGGNLRGRTPWGKMIVKRHRSSGLRTPADADLAADAAQQPGFRHSS